MQALRIVEALDPIHQVNTGLCPSLVPNLIDPFDLKGLEEAFGHRIDAPMSSGQGRIGQIRKDKRIQATCDVPLEAALDLLA